MTNLLSVFTLLPQSIFGILFTDYPIRIRGSDKRKRVRISKEFR